MATPSSSTTTPSPQLRFLAANAAPANAPSLTASSDSGTFSKDDVEKTKEKFLAQAKIYQLTRQLRVSLKYATYKATNNLAHVPLSELEESLPSPPPLSRPTPTKASTNYYNNPATQGNSAMVAGSSRGAVRKGSMLPPSSTSASATHSLYTSILAPPPSKRARTIHNPQDPPPVQTTSKPKPKVAAAKASKATRASTSSRTKARPQKVADKGKRKGSSSDKVKHPANRITPQNSFSSEDGLTDRMDYNAAAALTSLSRGSLSLSASSPRSNMSAGSDLGAYNHYVQSPLTRTGSGSAVYNISNDHAFAVPYARESTPPRTSALAQPSNLRYNQGSTTPKTVQGHPSASAGRGASMATDTEAADLMLFLATSPSPARPTTMKDRNAKDLAAFTNLSGSSGLQGRVLFTGTGDGKSSRPLRRDLTGSWSSTQTVATEGSGDTNQYPSGSQERLIGVPVHQSSPLRLPSSSRKYTGHSRSNSTSAASGAGAQKVPTLGPPKPTEQSLDASAAFASPSRPSFSRSSRTLVQQPTTIIPNSTSGSSSATYGPPTSGNSSSNSFNMHDYLNVPPSPADGSNTKSGSSLRADVGRRLFEGHHAQAAREKGKDESGGGLGAGIDLVKS
ncbi:hypothetical protein ABKN59_010059 [Abortiporus biennis]